jgi:F-type H+-transporting ATPase subunit b
MKKLSVVFAMLASPAFAASGPFVSLNNTNFIVLLAFLLFIGVLVYFKVPSLLTGMLDNRAETIKAELDEAKALRDEAQALLASYERKSLEVNEQAERIVTAAKEEAVALAEQAKADLAKSIDRRLAAADDQIESAKSAAVREVRDRAVAVAVEAARGQIQAGLQAGQKSALLDAAIKDVASQLN